MPEGSDVVRVLGVLRPIEVEAGNQVTYESMTSTIFTQLCQQSGIPKPVTEHRFLFGRRFRFDYAWPDQKVALEVEGGVWTGGRHTRGKGFLADMEKYNHAAGLGWLVVRCVPSTLLTKDTLETVKAAIANRCAA